MSQESLNQKQQIDLKDIDTTQLIVLLKKYNHKFGMGVSMFGMLSGLFDKEEVNAENEENVRNEQQSGVGDNLHRQKVEELLDYEQLKQEVEPILTSTGLELQPVNPGWTTYSSEGSHEGVEMMLNLKDGKKFVDYLQSLDPDTITESQKDGLREVASILLQQFTSQYDLSNAEDERLIELMGNLSSIIFEYKRLDSSKNDLTSSISKLEEYLGIARKGYLREYRQAEIFKLDKPFSKEGFVLRWHIDASPELLQKKWNEVIDTLQAISKNENANAEIYAQAIKTANEAIETAIADVTNLSDAEKGYEARKKEFLAILQTTKVRLSEF